MNDQDGSPSNSQLMEKLNEVDEGSFEILDELHSKLQEVEKANIDLKQAAIEHVRVIAKLKNVNQTLEAKVKKLGDAPNDHYDELSRLMMIKDKKIEGLIDATYIQDDLKEDLEQVQHQLDWMKEQVYFDTQAQDRIRKLEEKYSKDYDWFTQNLQELEIQLKSTTNNLHQKTMLLKEHDRKNDKYQSSMSPSHFIDSDDEASVERENQLLKNQMRQLEKRSQAHDDELMSA